MRRQPAKESTHEGGVSVSKELDLFFLIWKSPFYIYEIFHDSFQATLRRSTLQGATRTCTMF